MRGTGSAALEVQSTRRAISYARPDGLVLYSRHDRDISRSYPEVAALAPEPGLVLDGELVAWDERSRPDFGCRAPGPKWVTTASG
jgi:hypothetical protein